MVAVNHRLRAPRSRISHGSTSQSLRNREPHTVAFHSPQLSAKDIAKLLVDVGEIGRRQLMAAETICLNSDCRRSVLDVLIVQGAVSPQVVDFFRHQFPMLKSTPNSAHLGLILRSAGMLTARQEAEILRYQRMNPRLRFGEIAIAFGYCKPRAIAFFLKHLFTSGRTISRPPHSSIGCRVKRLIDVVGALIGLTATAALFIPLAIAIQMDSPGPILYSQVRLGLRGKPFRLWKFRSMVQGADIAKKQLKSETNGQFFKRKDDPRVTRVGKFIRKTSLDEFPQFWNVLVGDMSLVGTRPPTPVEAKEYEGWHWKRLNVKPGITGEWQVNGRSQIVDFDDVVKLDIRYQKQWSIKYDIALLFKTIGAIVTCKGSY